MTIRTLGLGLSALVAAAALATSPAPATGWDRSYAENTLWQLMNGARVNNGLAPLQSHGTLVSLARWRSQDMLDRSYFSHTIPGCGCDVYVYYTSNGVAWDWAGENIAWNSGRTDDYSPVRAHEQFMGSPGHRANVLDRRFTHGGVGAARKVGPYLGYDQDTRMYTQLFLQPKSSAPAPAPAPAPPPPSSGGGGGGGSAPSQPVAARPAPTPEPEPEPKLVETATPNRPTSSAGLDGVATRVSSLPWTLDLAERLTAEERAAEQAAALAATVAATVASSDSEPDADLATAEIDATAVALEVRATDVPEPGLLESIVGAVIGFLFG